MNGESTHENKTRGAKIPLIGIALGAAAGKAGSRKKVVRSRQLTRVNAGAVVGHAAFDRDAQACVIGDGGHEEGYGALLLFVGQDQGEGDARMVVDADMDELPTDAAAIALAGAVAGDAVADALEAAELLDVDRRRPVQAMGARVPIGVSRAFLWMFIRSSEESLRSRNRSFLDRDRMDNLLKAHS